MRDIRRDDLEKLMAEERNALDGEIARSGAPRRVRDSVMRRSADPLAGLSWQRIAAAVLVAGMLGGAVDLLLPEPGADDVTMVSALDMLDLPDAQ
jgi:hypothetical protein